MAAVGQTWSGRLAVLLKNHMTGLLPSATPLQRPLFITLYDTLLMTVAPVDTQSPTKLEPAGIPRRRRLAFGPPSWFWLRTACAAFAAWHVERVSYQYFHVMPPLHLRVT